MEKAARTDWPIVQKIGAYSDYPFEAIDQATLHLFEQAASRLSYDARRCGPVIKALECFLQITDRRLALSQLCDASFLAICREFLGALYSGRFIAAQMKIRYTWANAFFRLLLQCRAELPQLVAIEPNISTTGATEFVKACIAEFEKLNLSPHKVWLWRGWPTTNRRGQTTWLPLYPIYKRLGQPFTQRLHTVCDDYFCGRKSQRIACLTELGRFIDTYPRELRPTHFANPGFVTQFWREFFVYYMRTGHAAGTEISTLVTNWRNQFLFFVRNYLIPSGLFIEPYGSLPSPEPRKKSGSKTHISKTPEGDFIKTKLITPVPLQMNDSEAMEILFKQIRQDFSLITTWALWAANDIWKRYLRRISLAPIGRVRPEFPSGCYVRYESGDQKATWLNDRRNPAYLQNIAASFAHYGFLSSRDTDFVARLFPPPRHLVAYELGLPTTGSLLPHCVLLVAQHPKITPSFLDNFELYDKYGQRVGLAKTDSGYVMDGRKDRNGPDEGQQVIVLTPETAKVVLQMIVLTMPLRRYLRQHGDDSWRFLLLTCGAGFAYPLRVKLVAKNTSEKRHQEALAESLGNVSELPLSARLDYARRFSLSSLRAQAGVLIYLKERSAAKMAEALGHKEHSPKLLDRYLPKPIREFFQERWIRIFQTGIIVEALKDSPHLLKASSFENMSELDEFLQTHVLKTINVADNQIHCNYLNSADLGRKTCGDEVIFGINAEILAVLISLQLAVKRATVAVSGRAKYWAEITERLVQHIESADVFRQDLKTYLHQARINAYPDQFAYLIHE